MKIMVKVKSRLQTEMVTKVIVVRKSLGEIHVGSIPTSPTFYFLEP